MGRPGSAGRVLYPVALAVHSEHLALELLGWRTAALKPQKFNPKKP